MENYAQRAGLLWQGIDATDPKFLIDLAFPWTLNLTTAWQNGHEKCWEGVGEQLPDFLQTRSGRAEEEREDETTLSRAIC